MGRTIRIAAVHLALVAMLLRALLPAGWMPSPAAEGGLVLCTMDGVVHDAGDPAHKPAQDQHRDDCPFAAAPHLAAPIAIESFIPPSYRIALASEPAADRTKVQYAAYSLQSPRAPPAIG